MNVEMNYNTNFIRDFLEFRFINEVGGNGSDQNVRLRGRRIYKVKIFKCFRVRCAREWKNHG